MTDKKTQSAAAKKAADAKATKAATAAKQKTVTDAVEKPVETVELPGNEPAPAPVTELDTGESKTVQAAELQPVVNEEHAQVSVIAVEVRSTLERRCRAGYVFGLGPVRIEGDALDTLDYGALEADQYLHVEYITGTGDA